MIDVCPRCGKIYPYDTVSCPNCNILMASTDIEQMINHSLLDYIIGVAPKYDKYKERLPIDDNTKSFVLKRDEKCVICGNTERLKCHHMQPQGESSVYNLVTVCDICHEYIHKQLRKKGYRYYRPR